MRLGIGWTNSTFEALIQKLQELEDSELTLDCLLKIESNSYKFFRDGVEVIVSSDLPITALQELISRATTTIANKRDEYKNKDGKKYLFWSICWIYLLGINAHDLLLKQIAKPKETIINPGRNS